LAAAMQLFRHSLRQGNNVFSQTKNSAIPRRHEDFLFIMYKFYTADAFFFKNPKILKFFLYENDQKISTEFGLSQNFLTEQGKHHQKVQKKLSQKT